MEAYVTPDQFATLHRVDARTVQRWCKAGEIPGAVKTSTGWQIPADAMRITPMPGTDVSPTRRDDVAVNSATPTRRDDVADTLAGALAVLPALLTLEQASRLLGIPEAAVRRHAEEIGAVPWGSRDRLMVPARVVRGLAGI
jgi:hypothetical protein